MKPVVKTVLVTAVVTIAILTVVEVVYRYKVEPTPQSTITDQDVEILNAEEKEQLLAMNDHSILNKLVEELKNIPPSSITEALIDKKVEDTYPTLKTSRGKFALVQLHLHFLTSIPPTK